MKYPATPELDKMQEVKEESQKLGAFLDWLESSGRVLCNYIENEYSDEYRPVRDSIEEILSYYFDIDLKKAEKEREAILEYIRSQDENN